MSLEHTQDECTAHGMKLNQMLSPLSDLLDDLQLSLNGMSEINGINGINGIDGINRIHSFSSMHSSRSSSRTISEVVDRAACELRLAVAVSGGVDSMALLTALHRVTQQRTVSLWVFHVHHDLQTAADAWPDFVARYARSLGLSFDAVRLDASTRLRSQSVEEWARMGRYRALAELALRHGVRYVVLAQHQDDQLETHVMQRERGAGVRGLSAMPLLKEQWGVVWCRPWLGVARSTIEAFALQEHIPFVEDPSNADVRFARNALRAQWKTHPLTDCERTAYVQAIAHAQAQHAHETAWAQAQLALRSVPHRADVGECGRLQAWSESAYEPVEQNLLLREWMHQLGWRMPSRTALAELVRQLHSPRQDANLCWRHVDGMAVTRMQGVWIAAQVKPAGEWFIHESIQQRIDAHGLQIRDRVGGERVRLGLNRPTISLKHAYQMCGVPSMLRAQLPLLYAGEHLVYVVGVGDVY